MQFFKDTYVRWLGVIFLGIFVGFATGKLRPVLQ